jgi:hypothetical protein
VREDEFRERDADDQRYGRPPAEGERNALIGYLPQYEVAAGLLLRALTEETLECLALLNREAGRLDDFNLATPGRLDAYQIKWSATGGQMAWGEITANLVDLLTDGQALVEQHPDRQVCAHLRTNRVASSAQTKDHTTPAQAVAELLKPATAGRFSSPHEIPTKWQPRWKEVVDACDFDEAEVLRRLRFAQLEFGEYRPTELDLPGVDRDRYRRDVMELRDVLFAIAEDPEQRTRLDRGELLDRLPSRWRDRLRLASVHEFERPPAYETIAQTAIALRRAIDTHNTGYVALIGSPGSGKSTLLSQELRERDDIVARYYAYVRGRTDIGSTRAEAGAFLHDLVLTLERSGLPRGPAPVDFDVFSLGRRLGACLHELGERYREQGRRAVIMIDGLDHVERERTVEESLLRYLPLPADLPEGVLIIVGSQRVQMLHEDIRGQLTEVGRTVTMAGLDPAAMERLARRSGVTVAGIKLQEITDGHPLVLDYVLRDLGSVDPAQQGRTADCDARVRRQRRGCLSTALG